MLNVGYVGNNYLFYVRHITDMSCFANDSELLFLIYFFLLLVFYACAKYHLYIGISNRNYSMAAMIWFLLVSKIISMKANYCTKSVFIRIHSGPHFPAFGLNTDQNNSKYRHFFRSEQYTGKQLFFDGFASKFNTLKPTRPEKKSN